MKDCGCRVFVPRDVERAPTAAPAPMPAVTVEDCGPCKGCGFIPPYGTLAEWDHKFGEANCQILAARAERIEALEEEHAALRAERDELRAALKYIGDWCPDLPTARAAREALTKEQQDA